MFDDGPYSILVPQNFWFFRINQNIAFQPKLPKGCRGSRMGGGDERQGEHVEHVEVQEMELAGEGHEGDEPPVEEPLRVRGEGTDHMVQMIYRFFFKTPKALELHNLRTIDILRK